MCPSSKARSSLTKPIGLGGRNPSSSCAYVSLLSSIGGRSQSIRIWSRVRSLLASKMLCNTQQLWTTVGKKSSFKEDFVPISLNLDFSIPNPLSTLILVDECLRLNHTSSRERGNPIGPILNGVIHQLSNGYPRSATRYGGNGSPDGHDIGSSWNPPITPSSTFRYNSVRLKWALSCRDPGGPVLIEVK